ncbi:hypothetical protein [Rhizobium mongolense]
MRAVTAADVMAVVDVALLSANAAAGATARRLAFQRCALARFR